MKIVKPSFKLIVIALACFVSLGFIGTKVIGFINPAVADLDMNGYNIDMSAGGVLALATGSAAAPTVGWTDTGFFEYSANEIGVTAGGLIRWNFRSTDFYGFAGNAAKILNETTSATNPTLCPDRSNEDTGIGSVVGTDQLSLIAGGVEGIRVQAGRDNDLDNTNVYVTGLTSGYGTFQVTCDGNFAEFYLENTIITKAHGNALFTITKNNAATYNVYWDTTEFKIQNLVGDNKVMVWSYRGLVP